MGLIACQWAKALGVNLIGTVGSDEKAALAKAHGAAHVINYNTENFVERVKEITGGKGVSVVYDSIGKDTFTGSLDCLAPLGMMVSFGNASGPVPAVHPERTGLARLAVHHAAGLVQLCLQPREPGRDGDLAVRRGQQRRGARSRSTSATPGRCRPGARGPGSAQDDRLDHHRAMSGGSDGTPKFGRLLIVLLLAVALIGVLTFAAEAYYS